MDPERIASVEDDLQSKCRWVHDLRNTMNVLGTSVTLAHRLLEKGRPEEAMAVLKGGMNALERSEALLHGAGSIVGLGDGNGSGGLAAGERGRDSHMRF